MTITSEQIDYIARLARLKTNPDRSGFYAEQLSRVMELVEQMNRIDTSGVEPMSHPQDAALRAAGGRGDRRQPTRAISGHRPGSR